MRVTVPFATPSCRTALAQGRSHSRRGGGRRTSAARVAVEAAAPAGGPAEARRRPRGSSPSLVSVAPALTKHQPPSMSITG
eukprot:COSAG04_NODE_304_length_17311_cov_13.648792_7_plen_81_part_00